MPQGVCCGTPLHGSTCDPDGVGSLKKGLAFWNVSLFFYRSSGVDLLVALCTHSGPVFFSISCGVPLVEALLRHNVDSWFWHFLLSSNKMDVLVYCWLRFSDLSYQGRTFFYSVIVIFAIVTCGGRALTVPSIMS